MTRHIGRVKAIANIEHSDKNWIAEKKVWGTKTFIKKIQPNHPHVSICLRHCDSPPSTFPLEKIAAHTHEFIRREINRMANQKQATINKFWMANRVVGWV